MGTQRTVRRYCLFCIAASLMLIIIIGFLCLWKPNDHKHRDTRTWIAPLKDDIRNRTGFILALNSSDQSTGGALNIMSLQCLMGQIDSGRVVVVEPFITEGVWGAHLSGDQQELARENNVRLSDIYDVREWESVSSSHGYARLARWEDFLLYAPRNLIFVDFRFHSECFALQLKRLNLFAKLYNFRLVKTVCFDFAKSGALDLNDFKQRVYGKYTPSSMSVIFSAFGGVSETHDSYANRCITKLGKCNRGEMNQITNPSSRLLSDTQKYINTYLGHQTGYLSIMIRLEYIILKGGIENAAETTTTCIAHLMRAFQKVQNRNITNGVFFTMDIGKYGSIEFVYGKRGNTTFLEALMRDFFHKLFGENLAFNAWEESFQNISGLTSGGVGPYVAGLQKAVASRGRCIILAGIGSFQESAMNLYKENKRRGNKDLCYIRLDEHCNQFTAALP